jgi:hypothetical protein
MPEEREGRINTSCRRKRKGKKGEKGKGREEKQVVGGKQREKGKKGKGR